MSDKYEKLKEKAAEDNGFRCMTMQLYEKGLLSDKSLLDILGFDSEEEIKRKKDDIKASSEDLGAIRYKKDDIDVKAIRIEHARRNVDAMTKFYHSALSGIIEGKSGGAEDILKEMLTSISTNLKIMDEVSTIK